MWCVNSILCSHIRTLSIVTNAGNGTKEFGLVGKLCEYTRGYEWELENNGVVLNRVVIWNGVSIIRSDLSLSESLLFGSEVYSAATWILCLWSILEGDPSALNQSPLRLWRLGRIHLQNRICCQCVRRFQIEADTWRMSVSISSWFELLPLWRSWWHVNGSLHTHIVKTACDSTGYHQALL